MGCTAFSSRAFHQLPGASLKQKEEEDEEEVGLPVELLQTRNDPRGTEALGVDRGHNTHVTHYTDKYTHLQSWLKVLAPLKFLQKIQAYFWSFV